MSVRHLKRTLALLGTAAVLPPLAAAAPQAADDFKALRLSSDNLAGARAVVALGRNLPAVAKYYGKTTAQLRRLLLNDKTLKVARNGRLFYEEEAAQVPRRASADDAILTGALLPLDQTFALHSRPEAKRYIILNFQGSTITGTYWNTYLRRSSFVATPFNLDGNASTFSDAERIAIQQIWQRVAEDYAPFDVDVTTDISIARTAPAGSYATAVITRQADFFSSAPGVAFVSTFGNNIYEPAFVAYDTLYKNAKYIAEAVSHEIGHRLGLDHDGTTSTAYYAGHGSAPMKWAPIMGNSYTANVSQFSKGEYRSANNTQDDYAIMSRYLPLRADSAGDTAAEAAAFPASIANGQASGSVNGTIERQGEVDLHAIAAAAGTLTAAVTPSALGPNADLTLALVNDAGTVIASNPPGSTLNASITATIPRAGTYYLRVGATGFGANPSTGFSDYGSRGLYRLTASYPAAAQTLPVAAITATPAMGVAPLTVSFTGRGTGGSGRITGYAWTLGNGTSASTASPRVTYTAAGTYTAQLKVTDSAGFSGAVTKQVVVGEAFTASTLTIQRTVNPDGSFLAAVNVNNFASLAGTRLVPTTVYGTWSGAVQGTSKSSGFTRSGTNLYSPTTRNANACFTFTLDRIDTTGGKMWFTPSPRSVTACPQQAAR
ncbi:hypothetical protein DK847_11450 [Aestuariivirga litoralis]|uniref:PKD domain-containing protein n=1 Tax=Aestuariivirga litoralis TaxID=2650924 RepID=A0A2W2ANT2_9HYPH|nr:PKD domain-containing protein [Aestuariivirga litoralis]PZF77051.1 hypothetical protein DK847_11450 [Aestuariivirga litoralis]